MNADVERRIVKLRNELKAMKTARALSFSQLLMPERTLEVSQSGEITNTSDSRYQALARWRARFIRTDGREGAPMVNFPFEYSFSPSYVEYALNVWQQQYDCKDANLPEEYLVNGYVAEAGADYVDFNIDISTDIVMLYAPFSSITFSFKVQAVAMIAGKLEVERVR